MASLPKGCVNLFCSQVGRDELSLHELNKGTFVLQSSKLPPCNMSRETEKEERGLQGDCFLPQC